MALSNPSAPPLLEVRRACKRFPGVIALDQVNLTLYPGEILAVIGENGAGKSTLMKILAGVQQPGSGQILIEGRPVSIDSVRTASRHGIALIHQELNLADNLDAGANIFLGREPRRFGFINRRQIKLESQRLLDQLNLPFSPGTLVSTLSPGRQQMVEIAKALSAKARILIMDEPTSSLSLRETDQLFALIQSLRSQGVSIVYISHRLGEVKQLAGRVLVLRDGRNAGELSRDEIGHDRMVKLMVGRAFSQIYEQRRSHAGKPALEVIDLLTPAFPHHPINFTLRAGEIVGLAGLVGAGRTEMLRVLFGIDRALGGSLRVAGRPLVIKTPLDAIRAGMALVPENRKEQGLVLEMAVRDNLSLARLRHDARFGFLNRKAEKELSRRLIDNLQIKTPNHRQLAQFLSGGNQQKVVLGKWLSLEPRILLLDEPTRGIDVGAKQEIYRLMENLASQGVAILFVSSELEEILRMSERTLVMHEGRISGELARSELSEEAVMHLATGRPRQIQPLLNP